MIPRYRDAIVTAIAVVLGSAPLAAQGAPDSPATCVPECRTGYQCNQGQCISACNPACAADELCTDQGECVSKCNPVCAANEMCTSEGACISRCNPPCGGGARCTPDGECSGGVAGAGGLTGAGPTDPGWGRKAFVLSIISAVVIGALTAGIVIADDEAVGLGLGIPATLIGGITIPIIASGGRSERRGGGVQGNPGLRLAGWILYGLALGDAVVLIGLALGDAAAPAAVAGSVGLLGMGSALALGIEARGAAIEAETLAVGPRVGVVRDDSGSLLTTFGVGFSW